MINSCGISEEDLATYLNIDVFSDLKSKFHSGNSGLQLETRNILANFDIRLFGRRHAGLGSNPGNPAILVKEEADATVSNERGICEDEKNDLLLAVC